MADVIVDADSDIAREAFAVVETKRRDRRRFPETCVRVVETEAEAVAATNPGLNQYGARVYGPSRSSEGLRLYYLVRWLE